MPTSLVEINPQSFVWCTSLDSIIIPESVRLIGSCAFQGCTSLTYVHIPDGTDLENSVFDGCRSLKEFTGRYASEDGRCLVKDSSIYAFAPAGLKEYTIPAGITSITSGFYELNELERLTIHDSVQYIRQIEIP